MDIKGRTIWQIAAGDTDRSYANIFLDWDVIALGVVSKYSADS